MLAPAKLGLSLTGPPAITRLSIELPERSAPVKFVPISHAPLRFARASFAPARLHDTSRAPNRLAPARFARLKSMLLRSKSDRSRFAKSAGLSTLALDSVSRTWSADKSAAHDKDVAPEMATSAIAAALKMMRMKPKVVPDERRDKEIAMVVP